MERLRIMAGSSYIWIGFATCFVLVLLYATFASTPTPLQRSPEERAAAMQACRRAVRQEIADGRFPFDPDVTDLGENGLQMSGSVDSGLGVRATRRNYECFISPSSATGEYTADSVQVWQSH